jgi:hypothetical protein
MENATDFSAQFDELIQLYRKLLAQTPKDSLRDADKSVLGSIETLLSHYEMIKGNIPNSMLNTMSKPIVGIIQMLIAQLKSELGVTGGSIETSETIYDIEQKIGEIDGKLKSGDAKTNLDELLDLRNKLMNERDNLG